MYLILHHLLHWTYLVLPPAALLLAAAQTVRGKRRDGIPLFVLTCASAIFISAGLTAAYATLLGGKLHASQVVITWYFIVGLMCLIKTVRWGLAELSYALLRVKRTSHGRPVSGMPYRAAFAKVLQNALLVAIALPLVTGALIARRVRTVATLDPEAAIQRDFTDIEFSSTDGNRVAGWWVPASPQLPSAKSRIGEQWGRRTILMCHGLGEDRKRQMGLIWLFASDGYNVLAIDLRGQGESAGQWGSFGDRERFDVLGAARWLKAEHADGATKIFGLGTGTAGAALIAAATDDTRWGQSIDAVAVTGTFADLGQLVDETARERLSKPAAWLVRNVVMPVASAHAGTDLMRFAPAKLVDKLWPRPILVIQGRLDPVVPFGQGLDLFDSASLPKQSLWLGGDHSSVLLSPATARTIRDFFYHAHAVPII